MKEYREIVTQVLLMHGCVEGRRYNVKIKKVLRYVCILETPFLAPSS